MKGKKKVVRHLVRLVTTIRVVRNFRFHIRFYGEEFD